MKISPGTMKISRGGVLKNQNLSCAKSITHKNISQKTQISILHTCTLKFIQHTQVMEIGWKAHQQMKRSFQQHCSILGPQSKASNWKQTKDGTRNGCANGNTWDLGGNINYFLLYNLDYWSSAFRHKSVGVWRGHRHGLSVALASQVAVSSPISVLEIKLEPTREQAVPLILTPSLQHTTYIKKKKIIY